MRLPGCKPYAQAIAKGEADINQCPPGGEEGIHKLADLLGREVQAAYPPSTASRSRSRSPSSTRQACIGCTLCIQACPVDAIVGAAKQMHTVVAVLCTGCELCIAPCPVDCIRMEAIQETVDTWKWKYPVIEARPLRPEPHDRWQLFSFKGGVKPDRTRTNRRAPIRVAPLPPRLVMPLHQSIGGRRSAGAGRRAGAQGQRIGGADGRVVPPCMRPPRAPCCAIEPQPMPHPSGLRPRAWSSSPTADRWIERHRFDYLAASPRQTRDYLRDAGVVGLGGAVFPSHVKLGPGKGNRTLVLNGAECEPFITCDDMLMRERAEEHPARRAIMRHMLAAPRVLVGIEDNKPEAVAAMRDAAQALGDSASKWSWCRRATRPAAPSS
jgi:RnfABCDGE-type electron transport complex B subunit